MDSIVNVRSTILDDASWVIPFIDIETADKLPGVSTGATLSFEGTPPMEEFARIVADYTQNGARPG